MDWTDKIYPSRCKNMLQYVICYMLGVFLMAVIFGFFAAVICNAEEVNLDYIANIESSGNPLAYNKTSGARGLYQITPICLKDYNQFHKVKIGMNDLFFPVKNKMVAEWYFAKRIPQLLKHYGLGDTVKNRLWAYNAGISKVKEGTMPSETADYIKKYAKLSQGMNKIRVKDR